MRTQIQIFNLIGLIILFGLGFYLFGHFECCFVEGKKGFYAGLVILYFVYAVFLFRHMAKGVQLSEDIRQIENIPEDFF